jgi:hypothetical protein
MTNQNRKASDGHKSGREPANKTKKGAGGQPENETLPIERVKLANPEPDLNAENHEDAQSLLPHERDQTTRQRGSGLDNENERSRAVIGQAAKDTKRGLKDTDRRGIPSDIIASDADGGDA